MTRRSRRTTLSGLGLATLLSLTILAAIENSQLPAKPFNVLDIGCGDGLLFSRLQQYGQVEGVELPHRVERSQV